MAEASHPRKSTKKIHHNQNHHPHKMEKKPPSWASVGTLFTCKHHHHTAECNRKCKRIGFSVSLCSLRDNTKVMHKTETASPETCKKWVSLSACNSSNRSMKVPLIEINGAITSASSTAGGSFRGMQLKKLSGCYECHMVIDPSNGVARDPSLRTSICPCPDCGEIFSKSESMELHQAVRHAVSELGPEDSSKNIVEIIFQSSWLKKQSPVCKIDRILKIHNSQKTVTKFEEYRDSIKAKANKLPKKYPRCIADGNELLRFYCTTFICSIGINGSSNLCNSIPNCNICNIIRNGFKTDGVTGICTTATSGKAHDNAQFSSEDEKGAMLVCRVIAGRVKKIDDSAEEFDSVAGNVGIYSNLDELSVINPRAILPCFVVIYGGF
ncbi:putative nucleic acid binding protein [Cinnamomum micranthum f. kanehirae]|uniref:Putative nucleic acid binding protein n=1 Tax=Cinnamomum micranthum f. kanehirae TaxID=337451 RepID=A0A3S3MKR0_9MAGN|nr:putative nucleic acid binding protein [Cinnamomum micranthum f. kanehirae]